MASSPKGAPARNAAAPSPQERTRAACGPWRGASGAGHAALSRRLEGERRHGEVFPLPRPGEAVLPDLSGAPHYCRQRWNRRMEQRGRVQESACALNWLAAAAAQPHSLPSHSFGHRAPTAIQSKVLFDLSRRVAAHGRRPDGLNGKRALQELLATQDLYGQDPQHLARYDLSRLKVARGSVSPKPAQSLLPGSALHYIQHFESLIERDAISLQDVMADPSFPQPY